MCKQVGYLHSFTDTILEQVGVCFLSTICQLAIAVRCRLGVTRQTLSELVNERTGISVEMAIRLAKAFGLTPETWLGMQMAYDLWQVRSRAGEIAVERFETT